jgi:hypothetical protein
MEVRKLFFWIVIVLFISVLNTQADDLEESVQIYKNSTEIQSKKNPNPQKHYDTGDKTQLEIKVEFVFSEPGFIRRTAISSNGNYAAAIYIDYKKDELHRLVIYDIYSKKLLHQIPIAVIGYQKYNWRSDFPDHNILSFTADSKQLLSYVKGSLVLINPENGKMHALLNKPILAATPTHIPNQFIVRDKEKVFILDEKTGKESVLVDLGCSNIYTGLKPGRGPKTTCKDVAIETSSYIYFSTFYNNGITRCHLGNYLCESATVLGNENMGSGKGYGNEFTVLYNDAHLVTKLSYNGIAAYQIKNSPFRVAAAPQKYVKFGNEITLISALNTDTFISGRRYYFIGFLKVNTFKAITELGSSVREETATHVMVAPEIRRGVIGTTVGRMILFSY